MHVKSCLIPSPLQDHVISWCQGLVSPSYLILLFLHIQTIKVLQLVKCDNCRCVGVRVTIVTQTLALFVLLRFLMSHKRYQPILPCGNKMLQKRWDDTYYQEHRRRVSKTTCIIKMYYDIMTHTAEECKANGRYKTTNLSSTCSTEAKETTGIYV